MAAIISIRIGLFFNILNSILVDFVHEKLRYLPAFSGVFSTLPNAKIVSRQPNPSPAKSMDPAELKRVFDMFDKNGDGKITQKELSDSLRDLGISIPEEELIGMINAIDVNHDGCVDLSEFEELYRSIMGEKESDEGMREAFNVFDQDGDGYITFEELSTVLESLKQGKSIEDCKVMIGTVDADGDGRVDFKEFVQMMKGAGFMDSSSS